MGDDGSTETGRASYGPYEMVRDFTAADKLEFVGGTCFASIPLLPGRRWPSECEVGRGIRETHCDIVQTAYLFQCPTQEKVQTSALDEHCRPHSSSVSLRSTASPRGKRCEGAQQKQTFKFRFIVCLQKDAVGECKNILLIILILVIDKCGYICYSLITKNTDLDGR